jgi:hypothetical protein
MAGFMDGYRQGVARARAARGAVYPDREERFVEPEPEFNARPDEIAQFAPGSAELETALREREAEIEQHKKLLAELAEFTEQQKARIAELEAMIAPLVAVLLIPGVKTGLINRFHPDKHPEADEATRTAYNEALRVINEAYAVVNRIQASG